MSNSTETEQFGLSSFSEPAKTAFKKNNNNKREDLPKVDWLRLQDGDNDIRIVTPPFKYQMVRFKTGPQDNVGKRVRCSAPVKECPAVKQAGCKPKERWLVGCIDRRDNKLKIFDMSVQVYDYLNTMENNIKIGSPLERDINVRVNKDGAPATYYSTTHYDKTPLSEEDVALIDTIGRETLEKVLARHSMPLRPETVIKRLEELGWDGTSQAASADDSDNDGNSKSNVVSLPQNDEDDYKFDRPAGQA
jgi:hypothetical protein